MGRLEEILKIARARSQKLLKQKMNTKRKEGYNFYVHAPGMYQVHKVYFRSFESATIWLKKHPAENNNIYDLNGKIVGEEHAM